MFESWRDVTRGVRWNLWQPRGSTRPRSLSHSATVASCRMSSGSSSKAARRITQAKACALYRPYAETIKEEPHHAHTPEGRGSRPQRSQLAEQLSHVFVRELRRSEPHGLS